MLGVILVIIVYVFIERFMKDVIYELLRESSCLSNPLTFQMIILEKPYLPNVMLEIISKSP